MPARLVDLGLVLNVIIEPAMGRLFWLTESRTLSVRCCASNVLPMPFSETATVIVWPARSLAVALPSVTSFGVLIDTLLVRTVLVPALALELGPRI